MAVASALLLVLSMCCLVCSQPGLISLDCGGKGGYNDTHNISWTSDQRYIEAGEIKSIAVANVERKIERPFTQLRCFPQGKRNCYSLLAMQGRKYIIRAYFLYGDYDGLQSQPRFELLVDANPWISVVINKTWEIIETEVIVMARSSSISVCVARSGDDTPFISALELRPINPSMYPAVGVNHSLNLIWRLDYGSQLNSAPVRYYTAHRLTEKSDVFSFGVVLMEIICGRRPLFVDSSTGPEPVHITSWVRPALLKGDIESIADPTLLTNYNVDAMWKVAELAMVCTSPYSISRPAMNEVVLELKEAIRFQTGYYANLKLHEFRSPGPLLYPSTGNSSILDSDISLYPVAR